MTHLVPRMQQCVEEFSNCEFQALGVQEFTGLLLRNLN